jgi:hypothetical protein
VKRVAVDDPSLLASYEATTWRVRSPAGTLLIRIHEPSPLSDCGLVTAFNPASRLLPRAANRVANRELLNRLRRMTRVRVCPAVALGHGPAARLWREPTLAVEGLAVEEMVGIGASYGQNAIVWIAESGIPRLVVARTGFCGRLAGDLI